MFCFCTVHICPTIVGLFGHRTTLEIVCKTTVDIWSAQPTEQIHSYLSLLKLPSIHHGSYSHWSCSLQQMNPLLTGVSWSAQFLTYCLPLTAPGSTQQLFHCESAQLLSGWSAPLSQANRQLFFIWSQDLFNRMVDMPLLK